LHPIRVPSMATSSSHISVTPGPTGT
jgi:hypothetical protein